MSCGGTPPGDRHMKTMIFKNKRRNSAAAFVGSMRSIALDAGLGAAVGLLYGVIFGGFDILIHGDVARIVPVLAYCALGGASCIVVVGFIGHVVAADQSAEPS